MSVDPPQEAVTRLLASIRGGDERAKEKLFQVVYRELQKKAHELMMVERRGHTLAPTAMLNQAMARLLKGGSLKALHNRRLFFAAATRAMQAVLVDHARRRKAIKWGGNRERVPLQDDALFVEFDRRNVRMLDLKDALDELATLDERACRVVRLRYFGGLSVREIAEQLEVSVSTVEGDQRTARAWLADRLRAYDANEEIEGTG